MYIAQIRGAQRARCRYDDAEIADVVKDRHRDLAGVPAQEQGHQGQFQNGNVERQLGHRSHITDGDGLKEQANFKQISEIFEGL